MNRIGKINFKESFSSNLETEYLLSKEPLDRRVQSVYGTLSFPLSSNKQKQSIYQLQEEICAKSSSQETPPLLSSGDTESGTFLNGLLHGDNCTRKFKDKDKGTYTGRFVEGKCVLGKRVYYPAIIGNENGYSRMEEEGSFDRQGLLDGSDCKQVNINSYSIDDPSAQKIWEFTGTFEKGILKEGEVNLYCFCDGLHSMKGTFKGGVLDGENCQFISPSKYEMGRFKEGKLTFGVRTIRSKQQGTVKEEGSFDPATGNLDGKSCTISTAKWSLKGEAIQGTIKKGQLTILTKSMRLDEPDKEVLRQIGFLGFYTPTWWEKLSS